MNWKIATGAACILTMAMAAALSLRPGHPAEAAAQNARTVPASATAPAPVLVELFTSQGCSSCPPADAVLARIQSQPNVVALSRPVTYWDRLGWPDTLAREANTTLQRAYAARGVGGGGVYTPGAVVNGRDGLVGSQETALRRLIASARSQPNHALLAASDGVSTRGTVTGAAELRFVAVANLRSVRIGGGENGGRTVRYHNVVLDEVSVACAADTRCTAAIPTRIAGVNGKDRIAIILQRPGHGEVLAARWL